MVFGAAIQGDDNYPASLFPPSQLIAGPRKDVFACKKWCKETPGCGAFTYFQTAVENKAFDDTCHLKGNQAFSSFLTDSEKANSDTISGKMDCFKGVGFYGKSKLFLGCLNVVKLPH